MIVNVTYFLFLFNIVLYTHTHTKNRNILTQLKNLNCYKIILFLSSFLSAFVQCLYIHTYKSKIALNFLSMPTFIFRNQREKCWCYLNFYNIVNSRTVALFLLLQKILKECYKNLFGFTITKWIFSQYCQKKLAVLVPKITFLL